MKKKKSRLFWIIIGMSFIIFMILYVCKEAGYYEYKAYQKVTLTEEAIKRFEEDVYQGKDVKASDYIIVEDTDYSNKFSCFGAKIGEIIDNFMNNILKNTMKILGKLFWD